MQRAGDLRAPVCGSPPAGGPGAEEGPDRLRREPVSGGDHVALREDPLSGGRLLFRAVVHSERQIPESHLPRETGLKSLL